MPGPRNEISAFALACSLPALRAEEDKAEAAYFRLPHGTDAYARARTAWIACTDRTSAVEAMVLAAEPRTLSDAAAQILMAIHQVGIALDCEDNELALKRVNRALQRTLFVVVAAAEIHLADIALDIYAWDAERPAGGEA